MKCTLAGAVMLASVVLISSRQAVHAEEIPQQYMDMVNRGLAWLAKAQQRDGHWEAPGGAYPVAMTGMSGPSLQQELTRQRRSIPIVFITADPDEDLRPQLLETGAIECLFKPFTEAALLAAVTMALRAA